MSKNKNRNEDTIKNYLNSIANQQQLIKSSHEFSRTLARFHKPNNPYATFRELSDWNQSREVMGLESSSLPKLFNIEERIPDLGNQSRGSPRYQSQLLKVTNRNRNQQNCRKINPKIFEFNSRIYSKSPKKSPLFFHKVLHMSEHKKLEQTLKLTSKQGAWPRIPQNQKMQVQTTIELDKSFPKTEKASSILRMLKRRQNIKVYRKKKNSSNNNMELLKGIKFAY